MHPRYLEIPFILRVRKGSDEPTRSGVDMNRNRDSSFGFVFVEFVRHALDGFEDSGIG